MKITKVKVENFKCFDEAAFDTSKITLLTGANSTGKSSLSYAILGAIQSGEFPLHFSPNGEYVTMGDYNEFIFQHDQKKTLKFYFETDHYSIRTIETEWINQAKINLPKLHYLKASSEHYNLEIKLGDKYNLKYKYFPEKDKRGAVASPEFTDRIYTLIDEYFDRVRDSIKSGNNLKADSNKGTSNDKPEDADKVVKRFTNVKTDIKLSFTDLHDLEKLLIHDEHNINHYLETSIRQIKTAFTKFSKKINYISSFRLNPKRTYYETTKTDLKVGIYGERYEDQIIFWQTKKSPKFRELINILKKLGLINSLKSKRLGGGRYEILVKNKNKGTWSSLTDVGFGISQFLPIIVADLQLEKGSTLFIAQPETHLHPKIQAQFADYLIEQIKENNKNYIIETHSEYLINRLRLGLAKGTIEEEDIKTYYLENDGYKADIHNIKLRKNGQIDDAPESFFDTYLMDVMNIALVAVE